jgi:hypothetical protein
MKKLMVVAVLFGLAYGGWRVSRGPGDEARLFYGRVWIDHRPASPTEKFQVFGTGKKNPFGWFADRSAWKGEWEMFRYEPRGKGQIEIFLPHSQKKQILSYRAWACEEGQFDYCLELSGPAGPRTYYSRKGWERQGFDEAAFQAELAVGFAP